MRDYPQLPLEVDPPEHGAYRALLEPILGRRAIVALEPEVRAIARGLVAAFARARAAPRPSSTSRVPAGRNDDRRTRSGARRTRRS